MIYYDHNIRVYYRDVDQMGIVYNTRYPEYFEESRTELISSIGLSVSKIERSEITLPVVSSYCKYFRGANKDYLEFAKKSGFNSSSDPIIIELYSEKLQKFKLAGMGLYDGPQPKKERDQFRLSRFFCH